jgi:hypothetical protein
MARRTDDSGGAWLTVLVAGLIVVVAVIGYLIYSGAASSRAVKMAVNLPAPAATPSPSPLPAPLPKPVG